MVHNLPIIYGVISGMLAAGIAICSKLMSPAIPALVKVFLRFAIAAVFLAPFISYAECKKVTKKDAMFLSAMGLFFVVIFNSLFFTALRYIDPITSALILSAQPMMTLIVSSILFAHVPTKRALAGFIIALCGVSMVITKGYACWPCFTGNVGEVLMVGALLSQVLYTMTLRRVTNHFSGHFITFCVAISGLLLLSPWFFTAQHMQAIQAFCIFDWACMAYIGIAGTACAIVLFSMAVQQLGAASGSLIVFSTLPVATMIYSHFMGQSPSAIELLGSLCVIIGLVLGLSKKKS